MGHKFLQSREIQNYIALFLANACFLIVDLQPWNCVLGVAQVIPVGIETSFVPHCR